MNAMNLKIHEKPTQNQTQHIMQDRFDRLADRLQEETRAMVGYTAIKAAMGLSQSPDTLRNASLLVNAHDKIIEGKVPFFNTMAAYAIRRIIIEQEADLPPSVDHIVAAAREADRNTPLVKNAYGQIYNREANKIQEDFTTPPEPDRVTMPTQEPIRQGQPEIKIA